MDYILKSREIKWIDTVKDPFNTKSVAFDKGLFNVKTHCFTIHEHKKVKTLNDEINLLSPYNDISQYTEMFRITSAGVRINCKNGCTMAYSYLGKTYEAINNIEVIYIPLSHEELFFRSNDEINETHIVKLQSNTIDNFEIHIVQHVEIIPKGMYSIMFK